MERKKERKKEKGGNFHTPIEERESGTHIILWREEKIVKLRNAYSERNKGLGFNRGLEWKVWNFSSASGEICRTRLLGRESCG
ncbi:hypothetical protein HKD37_09G024753 [Glycine soja]